jgi:hypothetical protein
MNTFTRVSLHDARPLGRCTRVRHASMQRFRHLRARVVVVACGLGAIAMVAFLCSSGHALY